MEMGNNLTTKMYHIVYMTINKVNKKIYIGVHSTDKTEFDGYLGCGVYVNSPKSYKKGETLFKRAVAKYGVKNFFRITLKTFESLEDALSLESLLVNENFVSRTDTYNLTLGGGYPPRHDKKVYQYDLLGNFIKVWDSIKDVVTYYGCGKDYITLHVNTALTKLRNMGYM